MGGLRCPHDFAACLTVVAGCCAGGQNGRLCNRPRGPASQSGLQMHAKWTRACTGRTWPGQRSRVDYAGRRHSLPAIGRRLTEPASSCPPALPSHEASRRRGAWAVAAEAACRAASALLPLLSGLLGTMQMLKDALDCCRAGFVWGWHAGRTTRTLSGLLQLLGWLLVLAQVR